MISTLLWPSLNPLCDNEGFWSEPLDSVEDESSKDLTIITQERNFFAVSVIYSASFVAVERNNQVIKVVV